MHELIQPGGWKPASGYANGVLAAGACLFVAGQVGWTKNQEFEARDFVGQAEQALRNIVEIVEAAGGTAADIVRLTWFITDKQAYLNQQKPLGEAYRRVMGRHFPAMTLVVVSGLIEPDAVVEIEATAAIAKTESGRK